MSPSRSNIETRFNALLNAAVDAIIIIESDGMIESINPAAEKMFGYKPGELIGKNVSMLMPEPYSGQHDQYLQNYHHTGKAKIIGIGREAQAKRRNGQIFPIDLSVGEIIEGDERRFIGIIRDITVRKEAQAEARDTREKLAHITRLSTMGEMASGIAHEINQPLAAIAAYAQACRRMITVKDADLEKISSVLDKINAQAQRAGEVIRRLRTFFKKRKSEHVRSDLNELIRDSVDLNHADTRVLDHPVILELVDNLPPVSVDPVQIQQVVLNLLRNAIDAMENKAGKPVIISTRQHDDDFLEIVVADHGDGIDEQTALSLFNPFFSTKKSGMGMGLPISQSIVNSHGGQLWYQPNELGSAFHFVLPVAAPQQQTTHSQENLNEP
ncbi:MAG: PAS domain S-box protein [Gammaproteobacteria bacterium]|nr:PAS domain S-box protein [Gammaproteobacteria bacterium]